MNDKLPSFQFYPADWRKDPGVQSLSFEDRGVWLELLCLMHESPRRGVLLMPTGAQMATTAAARIIGMSPARLASALKRIADAGVSGADPETGAVMNRRMVRDDQTRRARAEGGQAGAEHGKKGASHGAKGGRPRHETGSESRVSVTGVAVEEKPPLEPPTKPSPSSSPSSSTSPSGSGEPGAAAPDHAKPALAPEQVEPEEEAGSSYSNEFEAFWRAYPRKEGKGAAYKAWKKLRPSARLIGLILEAVIRAKGSKQWREKQGQFIPQPATWLNQARWDDEPDSTGGVAAPVNSEHARTLEYLPPIDEFPEDLPS